MKILFVAAEGAPFAKTGGLSDYLVFSNCSYSAFNLFYMKITFPFREKLPLDYTNCLYKSTYAKLAVSHEKSRVIALCWSCFQESVLFLYTSRAFSRI